MSCCFKKHECLLVAPRATDCHPSCSVAAARYKDSYYLSCCLYAVVKGDQPNVEMLKLLTELDPKLAQLGEEEPSEGEEVSADNQCGAHDR